MTYREPARRTTRRVPTFLVAGLLVVIVAIAASLGYPLLSSAVSTAHSSPPAPSSPSSPPAPSSSSSPPAPSFSRVLRGGDHGRATSEADGTLPDGVTVFDDEYPGVANLDPDLLQALREAATDAAADGIEFNVNSGWRSREYQRQLFRAAVSKYGSEKEAARWVATADTSAHVSGDAIDIGPLGATAWLSEHGAKYGLCQIYRNEIWHYELRLKAIDRDCPAMYADSAHDPSLQH
jgi:zinc D-Ala-D-Ala carboxypeptidase